MTDFQTDLRQLTGGLSDALDLVGVADAGHGKRVAIMAAELGRALGLEETDVTYLFDLGRLHDLAVSSTKDHKSLISEFDWPGAKHHCNVGHALLESFSPLSSMALPVRYHHTRWERLVELEVDPADAWKANLIFLVDRVDALMAPYFAGNTVLMHTREARDQIRKRAGTYFAPDLVELFLETSASEEFWLALEPHSIENYLRGMQDQGPGTVTSLEEVRQLAEIFSRVVDAKSDFTPQHSLGVARLSRLLAGKVGLSRASCEKIEVAGLLHDLGMLGVPDEILDKPGKLDSRERGIINAHALETHRILRHISGFEEIAHWAATHHEEPGGNGYPFHLNGEALNTESRILRVADIFQALVQDRPYRKKMKAIEVQASLLDLVASQLVDAGIVAMILSCMDEAMAAARGEPALA